MLRHEVPLHPNRGVGRGVSTTTHSRQSSGWRWAATEASAARM
jgi:hypothetical protein